jgi:aldose 1-epimerase
MPQSSPFGTTTSGRAVQRLALGAGDLSVALLTWGAVVQSVRLRGVAHDLTLGSDRLSDYQGQMRHHGSLIGPVVNRITGATAQIAGQTHRFDANQSGRITLHSGAEGTHLKVWTLAGHDDTSATLTLTLPDGMGGFPGMRHLTARFSLHAPATLRLDIMATTDAATLMNMANHSYWNLDGTPDWSGHRLLVNANRYLPGTPDFTPTGEIAPVSGAMDFRTARRIAPHHPALDNNFCLAGARRALTHALTLTGQSGVTLDLHTTEPGVQVYDGRDGIRPGRAPYEGLAIEAQFWPDTPNHPAFPDIMLHPGQKWHQTTEWRFGRGA